MLASYVITSYKWLLKTDVLGRLIIDEWYFLEEKIAPVALTYIIAAFRMQTLPSIRLIIERTVPLISFSSMLTIKAVNCDEYFAFLIFDRIGQKVSIKNTYQYCSIVIWSAFEKTIKLILTKLLLSAFKDSNFEFDLNYVLRRRFFQLRR